MAKFKITKTTTVDELKKQFADEIGGTLRVYDGRSQVEDDVTLVSIGAKTGELECRTSRTVGKFEEAFKDEFNLKVKVFTVDDWVQVLSGVTLESVSKIKRQARKADMEQFVAYKREEGTEESAEEQPTFAEGEMRLKALCDQIKEELEKHGRESFIFPFFDVPDDLPYDIESFMDDFQFEEGILRRLECGDYARNMNLQGVSLNNGELRFHLMEWYDTDDGCYDVDKFDCDKEKLMNGWWSQHKETDLGGHSAEDVLSNFLQAMKEFLPSLTTKDFIL